MTATFTPPPTPVTPDDPPVTVWLGATRLAALGTQWQDRVNDLGSFEFSMLNTDSNTASVGFGDRIEFQLDGAVDFVGIVEEIVSAKVAEGDEARQLTTFSGRSILAELDFAAVDPARPFRTFTSGPLDGLTVGAYPFDDVRYWNWASPSLDRTAWTSAVQFVQAKQFPPLAGPFGFDGAPEAWPYPNSYWICPRAIDGDGSHPVGVWYATSTFTTDSTTFDVDVWGAAAPDDSLELWLDGEPIIITDHNEESSTKPTRARVGISPGTHRLVAKVTHLYGGTGDITGLICAVFRHKATDLRGDGAGYLEAPLTSTSSSWKVADYPSTAPGFTPGAIVNEILDENQTVGIAADWECAATDTLDALGDAWGDPVEFSAPNLKSLTEVLLSLSELGFNFENDPQTNNGAHLRLYRKDATLTDTGVTLTPGVNCKALNHHGTDNVRNELTVRWRDGHARFTDPTSIADHGRRKAYLSVPDVSDGTTAFWAALAALNYLKTPTESAELEFQPSVGVTRIGRLITYTNRAGSVVTEEIMARTVVADEDGNATITIEIAAARDTLQARADRYARANAHGTLDGRSESAIPSNSTILSSQQMSPSNISLTTGGGATTIVGDRSSPQRPSEAILVTRVEADCDVAGASGSTTIRIEIDGSSTGTSVTLASGQTHGSAVMATPMIYRRSNYATVQTTAAGGHQGVTVNLIGIPVR